MKKLFFVVMISVMAIIGFVAFRLLEETEIRVSPQAFANFKSEKLDLKISYSRPYKNGRRIFGGLVKYGAYWRTGADEATEIEFKNAVNFGGESVDAGRYRLYTIPGKGTWEVVLNSELDQWGAFEPNHDFDVLRLQVPPRKLDSVVEQLTIDFESAESGSDLVIEWDKTKIEVPIR